MLSSTTVLVSNTDSAAALARSVIESNWRLVSACNLVVFLVLSVAQRLQRYFFGALSAAERASVREHVLTFLMLKLVFVGAVLNVDVAELLVWFGWFFPIGVLRVAAHLTKERVDRIATADARPERPVLARLLGANLLVLYATVGLVWLGWRLFSAASTSVLLLLFFDALLLALHALRTTAAFLVHIYDATVDGVWERRASILYELDYACDVVVLVLTIVHLVHLQYLHGLSFSLVDLVITVNVRLVWVKLSKRIAAHRNYMRLRTAIREQYKSLSGDQLAGRDDCCAICREKMLVALELPCSHLFHQSCLMTWLEEHSSCPNCRRHLLDVAADVEALRRARGRGQRQAPPPPPPAPPHHHHHAHAHGHAHGHAHAHQHQQHDGAQPQQAGAEGDGDDAMPPLEPMPDDDGVVQHADGHSDVERNRGDADDDADENDDNGDDESGGDDGDDRDDDDDDDEDGNDDDGDVGEYAGEQSLSGSVLAWLRHGGRNRADEMRQLREMFPHMREREIMYYMQRNDTLEETADHILSGRDDIQQHG